MNKLSRKISRTVSGTSSRIKSIKNSKNRNSNYHNKPINILSYNVSWESTSGQDSKWPLCSNNTNPNSPKHFSVCVNNIASVFDNPEYELDFITLQEAKNYKNLIKQSQKLKKMKYELHKSGLDVIATFWNDHVSGHKMLYTIKGEFEKGRPWMATVFNSGICLINVHFGHYNKNDEYSKMEKMLIEIKEEINKRRFSKKVKNYRYIISGDFNYDIKEFGDLNNIIKINETDFYYHPRHILTCCIKRRRHNDHVIDSMARPIDIIIPEVKYMASDHKPILVKLVKLVI